MDLSLPGRLPSTEDWAEAAAALRANAKPGDGFQIWPPWAERARLQIDALPVFTEEDLARADYVGAKRLWLLALDHAPRNDASRAREALRSRGAAPGAAELRFGALSLQPWDLHAPELAAELTPNPIFAEIDFVARRCARLPFGARVEVRDAEAGRVLHLRGGIENDKAYETSRPKVSLIASADSFITTLEVAPVEEGRAPAWQGADVPLPDGPARRNFSFAVQTADPRDRRFCFAAWTTR